MEPSEKELIRDRTDIVELISGYTTLRRVGGKYKGLCPFHQEKTASFNVDPDKRSWRCFGACGVGGDVFSFLEKAENISFIEAAQRLADRAGITITARGGDRESAERAKSEKDRVYAANAAANDFYRKCFQRDENARAYTTQRGLVHETLEAFQIGYSPDDWSQLANYLRQQKIHPEDSERAGLIFPSRRDDDAYTDRFRGRLLFPIIDIQERVVGFGGRLMADMPGVAKYLNSPETPVFSKSKVLYGLNRARKSIQTKDLVLVVEGYMDVVAAHQAGIEFVVATLGTSLTAEHVTLIRRYTKNVVLSFDADAAGVKAALRAAELLQGSGEDLSLRVLSLPAGEDPDSMIRKGNIAGFHKAIESALSVPEFRIKSLEKQYDLATDNGKLAYIRDAVAIIAAVPSIVSQDILVRKIAAYHPTYSTNSIRAEESVHAEVTRARGGNAPVTDSWAQPGTPGARQGGSGNYGANGNGNSGGGFRRTDGGFRRKTPFGQPQRPFVQPDWSPTPQMPAAAAAAETTILRALLSDEWCSVLRKHAAEDKPHLLDERGNRLIEALWPVVSGSQRLSDAIQELSDPDLANFADEISMADYSTPLSDEAIEDALYRCGTLRQLLDNVEQNRIKPGSQPEGIAPISDEQLRQWSENVRALKNGGKHSEDG